ncbi:MAG: hypothetical protein QOJ29_5309, partial [Thermoleophilaceae bacterium]|nr:hypothetical protein [Thermoleophilaceae bacterium]
MARLLLLAAPLAVVVALLVAASHGNQSAPQTKTPAQGQQAPGGTPSPGTAAPDPAQAALAGVDAFH